MTRFASCFLLIFGQLSFGGMLAISVPPFFEIERGFYKSSAAVYLSAGLVTAIGLGLLASRSSHSSPPGPATLWLGAAIWIGFCGAVALYLLSLWADEGRVRARSYTLSLGLGLFAVLFSAWAVKPPSFGAPAMLAYGLSALLSSLVLGLASAGMLLGHWYLIDPNLPVDYLRSLVRLLGAALVTEIVLLGLEVALFAAFGAHSERLAATSLLQSDYPLLMIRMVLGPLAALVLAWMTWRTLKIPQTMAATGLLYIAVMAVLVGEMLGRFVLFRTALPL